MIASYQLVDDGRASEVTELFTAEGRFSAGEALHVEGRDQLTAFFEAREANQARRTRHCLTSLQHIDISDTERELHANLMLFVIGDSVWTGHTYKGTLKDIQEIDLLSGAVKRVFKEQQILPFGY